MEQEQVLTSGRNTAIAKCIFTPTLCTAAFFISFLYWLPRSWPGERMYWVGGLGSLAAAFVGWLIGYRFRHSERLNWALRWLMMFLMGLLVALAAYLSFRDLSLFLNKGR